MDAVLSTPLLRRSELGERDVDRHRLDVLVRDGSLIRVRAGVYVGATATARLRPEEWIVLRARVLALVSVEPPLFSHQTAAALHGLPLYRPDAQRVHVILDERRRGAMAQTVRHRGAVGPGDVVDLAGLRVTSMVRTMSDIARTCDFETAVCTLDGALRALATTTARTYDADKAAAAIALALATSRRSAHGGARAARALAFADGRAQLPGESISRIRITEMGLRPPQLQVRVPSPSGSSYYLDFGLDDVGVWGEFDGRGKYTEHAAQSGRSPAQVLLAEKQREDWIRGTTGRAIIRWGWPHIVDAPTLARRFAAFHVALPSR
ncbi:hypothetical protein [Microbacterium sp. 5K110]|jgi:hypothetical protein|uniref:hypothetical protein n=1 Tax=unclassified Microbacterium TaxID=2609290 RepID=UPI0010FD80E2|nr:hypothetical protein [Microbacterium sp. 5K110]TLF30656.1 hypothetical protein FE256_09815 [Microbacterium sp. 5K110]